MSEPMTWGDTLAGSLSQHRAFPGDDREDRALAREAERREARSAWELALARDPVWQEQRRRQQEIADFVAGRGQVINIKTVIPEELKPLYARAAAAQAISWSQPRAVG